MSETLDISAETILKNLLADFTERNLGSAELHQGYAGPLLIDIEREFCASGKHAKVDFDLAIKELESHKLIRTGPMKAYDNKPGSGFVVIGSYSLRQYACLTEGGYRKAKSSTSNSRGHGNKTSVHISGGTFNQSPIGIGDNVHQQLSVDIGNDSETISHLLDLLARSGQPVDDSARAHVAEMVSNANAGNLAAVKPLFQRFFGTAVDGVKQVAWGVLTAIITKQMGMS
ncbi:MULTISPECIES: hypothetical protein [Burkholderia]|uniref:hypothetical protein n=1 Tax=Burkholderia TaxID=32008 RepID=UPI00158EB307|nr:MULTISPECIES: hypothetical protein [Burkholderia]